MMDCFPKNSLPSVWSPCQCVLTMYFGVAEPNSLRAALSFSLTTLFGLMMLVQVVRFLPEHYISMTNQVLDMLRQQMGGARG